MAQKKRKHHKNGSSAWIGVVAVISAAVLFLLNDLVFHVDGIPTVKDIFSGNNADVTRPVYEETTQTTISYSENNISVHFIDVGQGDCELIKTKNYNVLIDAGEKEYYEKVSNYLHTLSIAKLDYVIVTHPHSDHAGAMSYILEEFEIGEVIIPKIKPDIVPTTKTYLRMTEVIDNKAIPLSYAKPGQTITVDDAQIEIYSPVNDYDDLNNYSICCRLTHFNNSFLFTGDIEKEAENDILKSNAALESDVIKIAHHGSSSSSTKKFLSAVSPEYAVLEVGEGNSYNHPHAQTLERLEELGIKILRTDYLGTIVFWSDGTEIGYNAEKE